MGTLRVTQPILVDRVLRNIQDQQRRILELQDQLATGRRINAPSDDPIDTRRAINTRAFIAKNEQYLRNIQQAAPRLNNTETLITNIQDRLARARELTLQGANGSNSQDSLNAIAAEIDQILEGVLSTANTEFESGFVFSGTRTRTQPFVETRDVNGRITAVAYEGNDEAINVAIQDGVEVKVNESGSEVFQSNQDIFQTLIDIRDNLLAGDRAALSNTRLLEIDAARAQLSEAVARVGAVQNRLTSGETDLEDIQVQLQELLSNTVDADLAEVIIQLNAQENAFQAALSAGARVIQPSLLDFVR
ncbi:MAG: hypothetical protein AMXMBFR84_09450 [Candidatus Hydrogenedentota bacterium]